MKKYYSVFAMTLIWIGYVCTIQLNAQIIHVPTDRATIQMGINFASEGDTVLVAEGTYFENINFTGKAITVASQFLLDADTTHISKTIIDGSQPVNPDSASVVYFVSGEDTTSILTGFTITGGKGTWYSMDLVDFPTKDNLNGGGIFVEYSGAIIERNIIEGNHINNQLEYGYPDHLSLGAGISGIVLRRHTLIIRENVIRNNINNSITMSNGGGIGIVGANTIIEGNEIYGNDCVCKEGMANGGGIAFFGLSNEDEYNIVRIRNNIIRDNNLFSTRNAPSDPPVAMGGALFVNATLKPYDMKVSNNLIHNNYSDGEGGGFGIENVKMMECFNNTFIDNRSKVDGHDFYFRFMSEVIASNNIFWNGEIGYGNPISIRDDKVQGIKIHMSHNLIKGGWPGVGNMDLDPEVNDSTFELPLGSPAVGRGTDVVELNGSRYYPPSRDMKGLYRPNSIDPFIDIGAYESPFRSTLLSNANLSDITVQEYTLNPEFQSDSLYYKVRVTDTFMIHPMVEVSPEDVLASFEVIEAADILSENVADRTSTIKVMSSDSTTQKVYQVEFEVLSTDALLSELTVGSFPLVPEFSPETEDYEVVLPPGTTETPEVSYVTSHANAYVNVYDAENVRSDAESDRRTTMIVIPQAGNFFKQRYRILFSVDPTHTFETFGDGEGFRIFPNPFSSSATIRWTEQQSVERISLVNIVGETVKTFDGISENGITIPREDLPAGLYFLEIQSDKLHVLKVLIE